MRPGHEKYGRAWLKDHNRSSRCPHQISCSDLMDVSVIKDQLFPAWHCTECAELFPEFNISKAVPWSNVFRRCPCGELPEDMVIARVELWLDGELDI